MHPRCPSEAATARNTVSSCVTCRRARARSASSSSIARPKLTPQIRPEFAEGARFESAESAEFTAIHVDSRTDDLTRVEDRKTPNEEERLWAPRTWPRTSRSAARGSTTAPKRGTFPACGSVACSVSIRRRSGRSPVAAPSPAVASLHVARADGVNRPGRRRGGVRRGGAAGPLSVGRMRSESSAGAV